MRNAILCFGLIVGLAAWGPAEQSMAERATQQIVKESWQRSPECNAWKPFWDSHIHWRMIPKENREAEAYYFENVHRPLYDAMLRACGK